MPEPAVPYRLMIAAGSCAIPAVDGYPGSGSCTSDPHRNERVNKWKAFNVSLTPVIRVLGLVDFDNNFKLDLLGLIKILRCSELSER